METASFDALETIIEGGILPQQTKKTAIQLAVEAITKKMNSALEESVHGFLQYLTDNKNLYLRAENLTENIQRIKFIVAKNNKVYTFDKEFRGYVIVGKSVSVHKRSKKTIEETTEERESREQFMSLVENGISRLYYDGKYPLNKWEKNFNLDDILLQHEMPQKNIQEVYMGNHVYSPFIPIEKSIIMLLPTQPIKYQCSSFVKSSLLHTYLDESHLVNRAISKQIFYKNSTLKGIYFVQEGEVEVKSGRIIARGWTVNGKSKTSGIAWKFKPIPFIRFLGKYKIWKQFLNDLKLNEEHPFNIIYILGLTDDEDFTSSPEWKSLGKKKLGSKSARLPRLINRSIDEQKYDQIDKLRHYDDRISELFSYKQDILTRKLKGNLLSKYEPIFSIDRSVEKSIEKKKMLSRINSRRNYKSRQKFQGDKSSENVLIMSVLKKLESLADEEINKNQPKFKKDSLKMYPLELNEKHKKNRKYGKYAL